MNTGRTLNNLYKHSRLGDEVSRGVGGGGRAEQGVDGRGRPQHVVHGAGHPRVAG